MMYEFRCTMYEFGFRFTFYFTEILEIQVFVN